MNKPRYIETELGTEKLCSKCGEYWPLDSEFWSKSSRKKDGYYPHCKACKNEDDSNRYHKNNPGARHNNNDNSY